MIKRILSILLALVMVCSLLPVGVLAEGQGYEPLTAHDNAKHVCEHCDATTTWEAWGDSDAEKTKLPTSGHYYLVSDIAVASQTAISSTELTLCLNGKAITTTGDVNTFRLDGTGKVNITDCTAKTEEGTYKAGTLTAKSGRTLVMAVSANTGAVFSMYDGIITGCSGTTGCVANLQGKSTFNMHGGEISGNSGNSGVIYMQNYAAFNMRGGEVKNNTATNGGAFYMTGNRTNLSIENAKVTGNTASKAGGAIYDAAGTVTIKNSEISGNKAAQSGAIELNASVSSITSVLTLDGAKVTGNHTTTSYGAVHFWNNGGTASVVLKGETEITGNIFGESATSTAQRNLYVRDHWNTFNPTGLSGKAKIGLFVETSRINQTSTKRFVSGTLGGVNVVPYFVSDREEYMPAIQDDRLLMVEKVAHLHKLCNDTACTDHEDLTFEAWTDATKLPTSGNWYLDTDVKLTQQTAVAEGQLNLCLNGHTVEAESKLYLFYLTATGKVSITDCTAKTEEEVYTAGKLDGFDGSSVVYTHKDNTQAQFDLYEGIITGCSGTTGSVANLQGKGTFNMYGGEISGNSGNSGVIYAQNYALVNVQGGEVKNNTATNGGAFYLYGISAKLHIENAKVTGNTATTAGGAIYSAGSTVEIVNSELSGNKAAQSGAIELNANISGSTTTLTLENATITGNNTTTTYGAIHFWNNGGTASVVLKGQTVITGNVFGDAATSTAQRNLYVRDHWNTINPTGLSGNAQIGLFVETSRINQTSTKRFVSGTLGGVNVVPYFVSDREEYMPAIQDDRLLMVEKVVHQHKLCNDSACTDHADLDFKKWTDTTKLPTSGNWYLDVDVKLTQRTEVTSGNLNLCLNGHNIEAASNVYLFYLNGTCSVSVADCAAKTEGGVYTAGKLDAYDGAIAIYTHKNSTDAQFNLYEGIITGCNGISGCAANLQGHGTFNMYGGEISGNVGGGSGTIYMANYAKFNALGGTIKNNTAGSGGVFNLTGADVVLTVDGATITGNTATNNGGAIIAANSATVNIISGKITNNSAATAGAIYMSKKTTLNMSGGEISGNTSTAAGGAIYHLESTGKYTSGSITGNTAKGNASAMFLNGATVELNNVKITGNTANGIAAVYANTGSSVTLGGDVQITDNIGGGKAYNLYLPGTMTVQLGTLGENAKVALTAETAFRFISNECDTDYSKHFVSDRSSINVEYKEKKLYLGAGGDHNHCLCDVQLEQGCDHEKLFFAAWEDADSLPTNGNWYLNTDVTVTKAVDMRDVTLNLCLNGHTITMKTDNKLQIFDVKGSTNLNITDCAEQAGTITGGTNGAIFGNNKSTAKINLYNGVITGNSGNSAGAVFLQDKQVFNMYGGKITNNQKESAASYGAGAIAAYYGTVQVNIYGGEISGNKSLAVTTTDADGKQTKSGGNAGAIYAEGNSTQINLYGGSISGNTADVAGGAVYGVKGTTVNLKDAKLEGNTAGNKAGAVYVTGASKINLDGSELIGNSAPNGGAILIESGSHLEFTSGKISGNSATDGAGIYITTRNTFNMTGGEMSGNKATGNGGALALLRCEATITDGLISENSAKYGGGILVRGCTLNLKGGQIIKNTATNNGGGIKTGNQIAGDTTYTAKIVMTGGLISENTAGVGGGVIVEGAGCEMLLQGGEITKNTVKGEGGGLFISTKTTFHMEGGKITGNSAKRGGGIQMLNSVGNFKGGEISGNKCDSTGGGVYVTEQLSVATLSGTTFKNNKGGYGGAICAANRSRVDYKSGTISGNTAVNNGGGMYISTNCTLNMYGGAITGNTVEKDTGGGLYGLRSTLNLYGGTVSYNTSSVGGGGIMAAAATLNLKGTDVLYNTAVSKTGTGGTGGGVRTNCQTVTQNGVKTTYYAKINMSAGTIKGNKCGYGGGGILLNGLGAGMTMTGGIICENVSGSLGGGVYASNKTTFEMTGGEISRNEAPKEGGGLWLAKDNTCAISDAVFNENYCGKNGGAVYMHNNVKCTFTNVQFNKNVAKNCGGAIFTVQDCNAIMIGCSFTENESIDLSGGAVFLRYIGTVEDCVFTGNKSGANAGALYAGQTSLSVNGFGNKTRRMSGITISGTTFENNEAPSLGGAVYIMMSGYTDMADCTFKGNVSGEAGSAIWAEEDLDMVNVTATGNTSKNSSGAIYLADAEFDGQSYFKGLFKMSGDMIVADNEGGDLFLGKDVTVGTNAKGYGQNTKIGVTLDAGLLTQRIYGAYNYEGGDLNYVITYGDRSLTDPELMAVPEDTTPAEPQPDTTTQETEGQTAEGNDNTMLYAGIGGIAAVIVLAAIILVIGKKKKAGKAADSSKN